MSEEVEMREKVGESMKWSSISAGLNKFFVGPLVKPQMFL